MRFAALTPIVAVALLLPALSAPAPGAPVSVAAAATPARETFVWTAGGPRGAEDGFIRLTVRSDRLVDFDSMGTTCTGSLAVLRIFGGPERATPVVGGVLRKRTRVTEEGETVTLAVELRWRTPTRATGWIRATGVRAGRRCEGMKRRVVLRTEQAGPAR